MDVNLNQEKLDCDKTGIHKELRKCQGKRVRLHRFADDSGRFSENSLVGLLDLPNRAIKVSRDENSPKKKRRLENEEIQKLKKGQECFMQWPMRIGERFYDCPIKVAPDLFINLTTEKNIEDEVNALANFANLDDENLKLLKKWTSRDKIAKLRSTFVGQINAEKSDVFDFSSYEDMIEPKEN